MLSLVVDPPYGGEAKNRVHRKVDELTEGNLLLNSNITRSIVLIYYQNNFQKIIISYWH